MPWICSYVSASAELHYPANNVNDQTTCKLPFTITILESPALFQHKVVHLKGLLIYTLDDLSGMVPGFFSLGPGTYMSG